MVKMTKMAVRYFMICPCKISPVGMYVYAASCDHRLYVFNKEQLLTLLIKFNNSFVLQSEKALF